MSSIEWTIIVYSVIVLHCKDTVEPKQASISIHQVGRGLIGTNETSLNCTFTRDNVKSLSRVELSANINGAFKSIIQYYPDDNVYIQPDGLYLRDRITYANISKQSVEARVHFQKLLCSDEKNYRCILIYVPFNKSIGDTGNKLSPPIHLNVTVDPSVPDNLSYSAANLSITSEIVHAQNCSTNDEILIEGGSIIVLCDGNVGRPAGNLIVQKIQNNSELYNFTAIDNKSSSPDNCSVYHNSTFTVNLTAEDNGGHLRCAEERYVLNNEMSKKSDPLDVKYQVRTPKITGDSNELPRTLTCISTGNPIPEYTWYRITNNSDTWELYANDTQNITLTNVSDSGLYRCDVSNTIGCKIFRQNDTLNITFEVQATTVTTTTLLTTESSSTTTPKVTTTVEGSHESKLDNKKDIFPVIMGVSGGVFVLIVVAGIIIICRRKRQCKQDQYTSKNKEDNHLVHQFSTKQHMEDNNYSSVSPDDNGDGRKYKKENVRSMHEDNRKHNEQYMKKHAEDERDCLRKGGHQPGEHAMVNMPKKVGSNQNQGYVDQRAEYAQVNKVKKRTSYEIPMDDNPYASGQGIYDHAHDRRHKQPKDFEPYDSTSNISRRSEKVGTVADIFGKPIKQKQVAKIKPSGRSGYENAGIESNDILKTEDEPNTAL